MANALAAQNLINPVGTQKIGSFEYAIRINNSPTDYKGLEDLPIKTVNDAMVYIRDVAQIRDGFPPQTNVVHVDGNRSVLLSVFKNGAVSTLAIIAGLKRKLAEIAPGLPDGFQDQPRRGSVHIRQLSDRERSSRRNSCGRADKRHDPAFSR